MQKFMSLASSKVNFTIILQCLLREAFVNLSLNFEYRDAFQTAVTPFCRLESSSDCWICGFINTKDNATNRVENYQVVDQ